MIVATAGHIDHGKTLLVKTLTGIDTDRLPEEKARGISIDLGFAYLPAGNDDLIGFVDVPGHERFIRNMLAGVCGIDYAMLIVAADDGVMPQTMEHLHILDLLNVPRGIAVITKADRVDDARIAEVRATVEQLLSTTTLSGVPAVAVSSVSGQGIPELRETLLREAATLQQRRGEGEYFRYAIDRAFTVAGSGTVVTGTVFNGTVRPGDRVLASPSGKEVRVRGIQIRSKAATQAAAGQRCALNLTGADLEDIRRGDWILSPELHQPTRRMDVHVSVLAGEDHALEHWTPAHLHLATSDVTTRVAIRRGGSIPPGEKGIVQLVLDQPVAALRGDRFILRDQSAVRTIGGGIVLDPFAPATRRYTTARIAELEALGQSDPAVALTTMLAQMPVIDFGRFEVMYNLRHERSAQLYKEAGLIAVGKEKRLGMLAARHTAIRKSVIDEVAKFHKANPQAVGADIEAVRNATAPELAADPFGTILRELADARQLEVTGSMARIPGHNATANAADEQLWQKIEPVLQAAGFQSPQVKDLAQQLKLKEPIVKDFLHRKAKGGAILKVTADRFYPRGFVAALAQLAQVTAEKQPNGQFSAAQYRDTTGVGRSLAIEILEFLDTLGVTQRIGDVRKIRKDYTTILGPAADVPKPKAAPKPAPPPARTQARPFRR
jgi:selenocysteine-specific elongation factor